MKIQEFRKILKAIDECEDCIKNKSMFAYMSCELGTAVKGAVIQRRHNLIERLKMAGVSIDEVA